MLTVLAGGAIGSLITLGATEAGRFFAARREVRLHDQEAVELNNQLLIWVDDETEKLVRELQEVTIEHQGRNTLYSSTYRRDMAFRKAGALHRYRDQEARTRLALAQLRAQEGALHSFWRWRKTEAPTLTRLNEINVFLDRWRAPVSRHSESQQDYATVKDRTRRTAADALAELPSLPLD